MNKKLWTTLLGAGLIATFSVSSQSFAATALPDLIVTSVSLSPASPVTGQAVKLSAVVKNQGTAATASGAKIGIAFDIDGTEVNWSGSTSSLAVGASVTLTSNGGPTGSLTWTATAGTHTFLANVNDTKAIAESNTTNNTLSKSFTVSGTSPSPLPDLIVTSLSMSPAAPTPGQAVKFSAVVKNQGTAATTSGAKIGLAFDIDNTEVNWSSSTASLAVGSSITLTSTGGPSGSSTWSATSGSHVFLAHVNDTNTIVESNTTNNTLSESFTVGTSTPTGQFSKVLIIPLENTDYSNAIVQSNLSKFAAEGALLANSYGLFHPSEPNYLAMTAGTNAGITDDNQHTVSVSNIADLLEAHGLTWKAYAENFSGNCKRGNNGVFLERHMPFLSFQDINSNSSRCDSHIVADTNFQALVSDANNGKLADYSFYTPNADDDGHDTGVAYADNWVGNHLLPILSNAKLMQGMLVIITFDESETGTGTSGPTTPGKANQVYTALYGSMVVPGSVSYNQYDHYSVLRTIENNFGLGTLGQHDASATPIQGIWK